MRLAYTRSWLEDAIDDERDPAVIVAAIAAHPKFAEVVGDSVRFAAQNMMASDQTRVLAEHIAFLIKESIGDCSTMHG